MRDDWLFLIVAGDKLMIADIDTDILGSAFGIVPEEDQISRLELILRNGSASLIQVRGFPRSGDPNLLETIVHQTGIVEFIRADGTQPEGLSELLLSQRGD